MAATDHSRSEAAKQRRQDQLQRWLGSETDQTGWEARGNLSGSGTRRAKVRFAQGAVFMAACSAGDREEVAALLRQGADINHANIDGLTALHQACIDENAEMVQFLVESGSDVNRGDNEGWTPLHAAASCGFIQIAKYLIEHGAHVGAVNSEGELPLDVATEDAMERLLKGEIKKQGIDVDKARKEEERIMLQDAMAVLAGGGTLTPHPNTKATALHVAAAKGYIEVLKVLLQCGVDVDSRDTDGWTPLHAAAHWGQEEVCTLLADNMCDMGAVNNVGQTPLDVADENLADTLEELQKKQNALRSEKEKQTPVIETSPPISMVPVRPRRTSISRMSSKEKICLHEREKHPPPALPSSPAEDEEEEGQTGQSQSQSQGKASSSSSSEEESESESDAESEKAKNREIINNLNNKRNATSLLPTSMTTSTAASQVKKDPSKLPTTEAPGSWRTSLRKAGSSVTLGSAGLSDFSQDSSRPPETTLGMTRSASSPRLSSEADTKEPRLARVPPIPTRRLFSIPDSSPDNSNSWLSRSSSYTRRLHSQSGNDLTSSTPSLLHSSSYGKRLDDPTVTSASTGTSSAGLSRLNSVLGQRVPQEQTEKKDQSAVSNSRGTTAGEQESKQRRKSYLTPVRDEEAEAQRKARSRHARQSRRSTQGVTLTDLQEAEKTMKTDNKGREKKEEEEKEKEKEKEAKAKKGEEGEVSWRSRIASLQKSDLLGLTQPTSAPRSQTSDKKDVEASTGESETERWARERRERRQARARRKAQRTGESDDNDPSGEEEFSGSGLDPQTVRHLSSRSDNSCNDFTQGGGSEMKDFKKLFEEVSRENSQLQSQLQDTQRIVSQTRLDLEKATQRQERFTDCSALLELERKDRRMLERRMAELEEELKVLVDLRADNQRLKDENGALIRVISKLSK
ncbi:Protein phosphatase 1 regulatory subunit 12A MBSP Myosin phosphatase-targeting subunit 1 [Larimichthys crocea]|uniref:Protein phosphatase 1 regulatory subunit n=1 Tax=Larimichthys crocea TaxID=215358 RepID=A0A0F8BNF6_LARCR|nr:protein phosphatase 1 regulatory subunit 12A isoform X2 [Larimichthys crocea]KAE8296221.1 Protein phosphatase 1 regulatory subunit 12A MBSP Myosin phosphatase-targeting subunit 1 [Larimichthys crocea]